jgi:hypothetical protein
MDPKEQAMIMMNASPYRAHTYPNERGDRSPVRVQVMKGQWDPNTPRGIHLPRERHGFMVVLAIQSFAFAGFPALPHEPRSFRGRIAVVSPVGS